MDDFNYEQDLERRLRLSRILDIHEPGDSCPCWDDIEEEIALLQHVEWLYNLDEVCDEARGYLSDSDAMDREASVNTARHARIFWFWANSTRPTLEAQQILMRL